MLKNRNFRPLAGEEGGKEVRVDFFVQSSDIEANGDFPSSMDPRLLREEFEPLELGLGFGPLKNIRFHKSFKKKYLQKILTLRV